MRITDQYLWNFVFGVVFIAFIFMGTIILDGEAYKPFAELTRMDAVLLVLATFRLTRLFVYDKITAFLREQFFDIVETRTGIELVKPEHGPRRTLADLMTCPWCIGMWAGASVSFFYFLTPYAFFPILVLAIGALGAFLQLVANMVGWKAEQLKMEVERG